MINYKTLPDFVYNFAMMPQNTYDRLSHITGHSWVLLPTVDHMTPEGIEYFKSKGVVFANNVACWKCSANTFGFPHIDKVALMGFNFIVKGKGRMEWTQMSASPKTFSHELSTGQVIDAPGWSNLDVLGVIDTWDGKAGDCALVRVHTPHRVVTTDEDRYCLSFRLQDQSETYDQIVSRF